MNQKRLLNQKIYLSYWNLTKLKTALLVLKCKRLNQHNIFYHIHCILHNYPSNQCNLDLCIHCIPFFHYCYQSMYCFQCYLIRSIAARICFHKSNNLRCNLSKNQWTQNMHHIVARIQNSQCQLVLYDMDMFRSNNHYINNNRLRMLNIYHMKSKLSMVLCIQRIYHFFQLFHQGKKECTFHQASNNHSGKQCKC